MYLDDRSGQVGLIVFYVQSLGPSPLLFLQNLNQLNRHLLLEKHWKYLDLLTFITFASTAVAISEW